MNPAPPSHREYTFSLPFFMSPPPLSLSRRTLMKAALMAAAAGAPGAAPAAQPAVIASRDAAVRGGFSQDDLIFRIYSPALQKPVKLMLLADTHLFRDDERGLSFQEFSGRMSKAYNRTRHFRSGKETTPELCFQETLQAAREARVDAVVLLGDIVSYPSEAAVEWVLSRLEAAGLPWVYTAGNHDWHYEGMAGSSEELRATWCARRLAPLYQGREPRMSVLELSGLKVVLIDNSTCEIGADQLDFFRQHASSGSPMLRGVHIPLFAPGRPVGFSCGHPAWGGAADRNYMIEKRHRWRAEGHTRVTMDFHREVFATPHLLGVFAGHIHQPSLDVLSGLSQVVLGANATGAYAIVHALPMPPAVPS